MVSKREGRRGRAAARYADVPTADLINSRGAASIRTARAAINRLEPLVRARRVRPADLSSVAALADALTGAVLAAIGDLESVVEE